MISPALSTSRRTLVAGAAVLAAALTLAACGGSSSGATPPTSSTAAPSGAPAGTGFGGGPSASGQVAAISGTTMQVQNPQAGQVAVTWTSTTTFSHPVATTLSAVKAGDCVIATAPSGTTSTSFTATAVSVSMPVNGQCGGGPAGTGGPGNGQRPTGQRPTGFPSGPPGRPAGGGAFATGTISSVSGSSLVIAARQPGTTASTNRDITAGAQTKITTQKSTTSKSLKVGLCVSAQGSADSTGTVTASSVRISNPVNGQCSLGFGAGRTGG
jgi:hypothetical protein